MVTNGRFNESKDPKRHERGFRDTFLSEEMALDCLAHAVHIAELLRFVWPPTTIICKFQVRRKCVNFFFFDVALSRFSAHITRNNILLQSRTVFETHAGYQL